MNVWIYDENSYPSGFAGGWVPELMPEARGRGLKLSEAKTLSRWDNNLLAVYRIETDQVENVTPKPKAGESLPEARYLVASIRDLDGDGNNDIVREQYVVEAVIFGVTEADAKALNDRLDGPALGPDAQGNDLRGQVIWSESPPHAPREVHICVARGR